MINLSTWKFNITPLKIGFPKRKGLSSNYHFSGAMIILGEFALQNALFGSKLVLFNDPFGI